MIGQISKVYLEGVDDARSGAPSRSREFSGPMAKFYSLGRTDEAKRMAKERRLAQMRLALDPRAECLLGEVAQAVAS